MSNADRSLKIPYTVRQFFKPPIMAGENPAEYQQLIELVREDVQPRDLQEWLLAGDIVHAEWELLRLRGMKVCMLHATLPRATSSLIADGLDVVKVENEWIASVRKLLIGMVAGNEQAKEKLEQLLGEFGLTLDVVTAATFEETIRSQVHTDRMVEAAYERRNAAYAELERRRARKANGATEPSNHGETIREVKAPPIDGGTGPADHADRSASGKVT
jgi:hypothetical protein